MSTRNIHLMNALMSDSVMVLCLSLTSPPFPVFEKIMFLKKNLLIPPLIPFSPGPSTSMQLLEK